jgi:hypothetical protein
MQYDSIEKLLGKCNYATEKESCDFQSRKTTVTPCFRIAFRTDMNQWRDGIARNHAIFTIERVTSHPVYYYYN